MPIPDFQSLMLPIMKVAQDGAEHTARELRQRIGEQLGLTEEERKELLPSGTQPVFTNRIAWARSHLTMAGLLEKTGRGAFRITQRGKDALSSNPCNRSICDSCSSFPNTQKQEAKRKLIRLWSRRHMRPQLKWRHHKSESNSLSESSTTA